MELKEAIEKIIGEGVVNGEEIDITTDKIMDLVKPLIKDGKDINLPTNHDVNEWLHRAKSLPSDDKVKSHIDSLPYYGPCTTEYNEGFEDGVKWVKEQIVK